MSNQHQSPSTVQPTRPRPVSTQAPRVNGQTIRAKARHSMILSPKTVLTTANIFQTGAEQLAISPAQTCELRGTDHILHRYIVHDGHPEHPEFRVYTTIDGLMKLFKLDFNIKDRYRRGLADGARSNRSPQSEATATLSSYHDPHHHASSPSSPSALVSANSPSSRSGRDERMEQWNHFGSSPLEAAHSQTYAHPHARGGNASIGRLHGGQDYGYDEHHEDDASNDGYMSSSSSSSGGSLSSSALSPSSSHSSDDDDYDDDDDMQGGAGGGDYGRAEDSQDNEYSNSTHPFSISSSKGADYHDYYQGSHGSGEHGGLLPAALAPAIEPQSDREALEQEARQRRLERHADKRRQSLNGNQPAPQPRRKKRKKGKDLRKQVLLKNAQQMLD
ncbi:hypothetical protein BGW39_000801 [Mortierella sp. 14UC]|nr:hypothetical protein BGW39_000801 [Mortierella sp. 14UC]